MHSPVYTPVNTHLGQNTISRRGFWHFIRHNVTILIALIAGLGLVTATMIFTAWLGKQIPLCPDWAILCTVSDRVGTYVSGLQHTSQAKLYGLVEEDELSLTTGPIADFAVPF
jgi:hypothetical protein